MKCCGMSACSFMLGIISSIVAGAFYMYYLVREDMLVGLGKMVGMGSADMGVLVHLGESILLGVIFVILFGWLARNISLGLICGLIFGALVWLAIPLTLGPFLADNVAMGSLWNMEGAQAHMHTLIARLGYGAILGICYGWFRRCKG